ncbi:MAG: class I SAM-dependent methyltransferase [Flavobacteriia bacterium]|nr:class I SAM-dependent methyltransferase [Flavobacteriia bacterium]
MNKHYSRKYSSNWKDYELLDAGGGKKLERFGEIICIRPEIQCYFQSVLPFTEWEKIAHAEFVEKKKKWVFYKKCSPQWEIFVDNIQVKLLFTAFKHIGIFPEQYDNWCFLKEHLLENQSFINLFAYTGLASVFAAKNKAKVVHVDSIKNIIDWANENKNINQLENFSLVLEDALTFANREVKRKKKYNMIWMDPPAFGFGKNNKKWILEQKIEELIYTSSLLLSNNGKVIVNTYSTKLELKTLHEMVKIYFPNKKIEAFELWKKSNTEKEVYFGNCIRIY